MRDIDKRKHNKKQMKRSCTGKVKYPDETSAIGAAVAISHKSGEKYRAYLCRFCHCHHVGHKHKKSY